MCFQSIVARMEAASESCSAVPCSVAQFGHVVHLPLPREPGAVVPALERPVVVPVAVGRCRVALVTDRWREDAAEALRRLAGRLVAGHQRALTQRLQELAAPRARPDRYSRTLAAPPLRRATSATSVTNSPWLSYSSSEPTPPLTLPSSLRIGEIRPLGAHAVVRVPAQILARRTRNSHAQQHGGRCRAVADERAVVVAWTGLQDRTLGVHQHVGDLRPQRLDERLVGQLDADVAQTRVPLLLGEGRQSCRSPRATVISRHGLLGACGRRAPLSGGWPGILRAGNRSTTSVCSRGSRCTAYSIAAAPRPIGSLVEVAVGTPPSSDIARDLGLAGCAERCHALGRGRGQGGEQRATIDHELRVLSRFPRSPRCGSRICRRAARPGSPAWAAPAAPAVRRRCVARYSRGDTAPAWRPRRPW